MTGRHWGNDSFQIVHRPSRTCVFGETSEAELELQLSDSQRPLTLTSFRLVWFIRSDGNMIQRWSYKYFYSGWIISGGSFHFSNVIWLAQGCPTLIVLTQWGTLLGHEWGDPGEEEGWQAFPPDGYPGKFQGGKHVIMTSSKALLKPCTQPIVETFSSILIHSSSPERRLSWHHPIPYCTPRNWVSKKLREWLRVPPLDLVKFQVATDHQS